MPEGPTEELTLRTEGDVNRSPHREAWRSDQLDDATRETLDADARHFLHQSLSTPCLDVLDGCEGIYLVDRQGRRIMDFHGNSVHQVGFSHPRVLEAVRRQLETLSFCPRRFTNDPAVALARRLGERAPGRLSKVLLAPGGTSAVGIALKLARYATGRFKTLSMWDAFHGASLDAISVGGEGLFRRDVGPLLPGAEHVPPTGGRDCPFGCDGDCQLRCADYIDYVLRREGDVGALIAEPMRCTTVSVPRPEYWPAVREICDRHGVLLILDEIPTCLGRTGAWFACERFGVVPDVLVVGKGLGGGVFPLAAVIAREDLDVAGDRALGHYTHEKSPLGAAAALATLDVLEDEGLVERSRTLGDEALGALRAMATRHPLVSDVRGLGLLLGVELRRGDAPAEAEAEQVLYACLARGLSFKVSDGNVLTLAPPLTITRTQLAGAWAILDAALTEVGATEAKKGDDT